MKGQARLLQWIFLLLPGYLFPTNSPGDTLSIIRALSISEQKLEKNTWTCSLEQGGESLIARLWLFDNAKSSIDLQYYSYSKDVTGLIVSDHLLRAADRGVKIRILLDDAASKMYSHEIETLDSHENVEVRVYNAGLMLGRADKRIFRFLMNINRLLRRMHNKTFTVDGQLSILGGRNIADEYFDYDEEYNFRDREVILAGVAVKQVHSSFERFWNDPLTVPFSKLKGKYFKRNYARRIRHLHEEAGKSKDFSEETRKRIAEFPKSIGTWDEKNRPVWVPQVSFVSDVPGKTKRKRAVEGGACVDSMLQLIRGAKHSIDIQSPYFIVTSENQELLKETVARGVKIRLLTNSLASTDICESFSAYRKNREDLLKMGVEIYEFKPDAAVRRKLMMPDLQKQYDYKAVYGFHPKTMVIDGNTTVIGSYNFDPRSSSYNTECFAVIRSVEEAGNITRYMEEELLPENSWQISPGKYPDREAKLRKRIKAFLTILLPKKLI